LGPLAPSLVSPYVCAAAATAAGLKPSAYSANNPQRDGRARLTGDLSATIVRK